MTGHEYMMQVRRIELRIRRITLQIEELEASLLPQGIRYDKDKVQTSPEDTLSKITAKISVLEKLRTQLVWERRLLLLEIQDALDRLDNENEQIVLEAYYLSRMSMREIAEMINYSVSYTYRLRTLGLQRIGKEVAERG